VNLTSSGPIGLEQLFFDARQVPLDELPGRHVRVQDPNVTVAHLGQLPAALIPTSILGPLGPVGIGEQFPLEHRNLEIFSRQFLRETDKHLLITLEDRLDLGTTR
jgi:hypothetical protein